MLGSSHGQIGDIRVSGDSNLEKTRQNSPPRLRRGGALSAGVVVLPSPGGVTVQGNGVAHSNSFLGGGNDEPANAPVDARPIVRFGGCGGHNAAARTGQRAGEGART
jgi:hypothetical protein